MSVNYVGMLQEYCAKRKLNPPNYTFKRIGPDHMPVFVCWCKAGSGEWTSRGNMGSKADAKDSAAHAAMTGITEHNPLLLREDGEFSSAVSGYDVLKRALETKGGVDIVSSPIVPKPDLNNNACYVVDKTSSWPILTTPVEKKGSPLDFPQKQKKLWHLLFANAELIGDQASDKYWKCFITGSDEYVALVLTGAACIKAHGDFCMKVAGCVSCTTYPFVDTESVVSNHAFWTSFTPPLMDMLDRKRWYHGFKFHFGHLPYGSNMHNVLEIVAVGQRQGWIGFSYENVFSVFIPEKVWDTVLPIGIVMPQGQFDNYSSLESCVNVQTINTLFGCNCSPESLEYKDIQESLGRIALKKKGAMIFANFDQAVTVGCKTIICIPYKGLLVECAEHCVNDDSAVAALVAEVFALAGQMLSE